MKKKEEKQKEAKERQKAREQRTNEEQIAILDAKLGKGQGAKKERQKLTQ